MIESDKAKQDLAIAYCKVFGTDAGQLVYEDLLKRFYGMSSTFSPGQPDVTAHREGNRAVLLHIETQLNYNDVVIRLEKIKQATANSWKGSK